MCQGTLVPVMDGSRLTRRPRYSVVNSACTQPRGTGVGRGQEEETGRLPEGGCSERGEQEGKQGKAATVVKVETVEGWKEQNRRTDKLKSCTVEL